VCSVGDGDMVCIVCDGGEPSGPLNPQKEGEKGVEMDTEGGTLGFHLNLSRGWVPEISGSCGSD
jgi:hypothetical protein